jgi:hypothetical protein
LLTRNPYPFDKVLLTGAKISGDPAILSYSVELIGPEEKDRLYNAYAPRLLYTSKVEIYGCCIKILTDSEATKNKWEDNFYSADEHTRSHGRLIVFSPGAPFSVKYDPYTKKPFF